jgi:hypothetical protein
MTIKYNLINSKHYNLLLVILLTLFMLYTNVSSLDWRHVSTTDVPFPYMISTYQFKIEIET